MIIVKTAHGEHNVSLNGNTGLLMGEICAAIESLVENLNKVTGDPKEKIYTWVLTNIAETLNDRHKEEKSRR